MFSTKVANWGLYFYVFYERREPYFTRSRSSEPCEGLWPLHFKGGTTDSDLSFSVISKWLVVEVKFQVPRFQFSTLKNNNYTWYFRNINVTCKLAIASLIFSYVFEDWKVSLATQRCHGKLLLFGIFREIKTLKDNRLKVWILYIMGSTLAVCPSLVDFYESLLEYCASVFGLFKHLNQSLKITTQKKMDTNFSPLS